MPDDHAPLATAATPQPHRRRGVLLAMVGLLAVAGVGLATRLDGRDSRAEVSAAVDPAAHGPQGTARVTLTCGDTAETRKVTAFEAETTAGGAAALYWSEPAGRLHPLGVGDQFPAGARLAWAVTGVQLGPWDLDDVADSCTIPVPSSTTPSRYTVPPTSVTAPVPGYDPAWTARATLACGDTPGDRRVTSFEATTNGAGTASVMAWDPLSGRIEQLQVGDQFPVDHVLSWAIQGVFLGPWPVPQVTDDC